MKVIKRVARMLEAKEQVGKGIPSSRSTQKSELRKEAKHSTVSVRSVVHQVARQTASEWWRQERQRAGLVKMGDGNNNMLIYDAGGGIFDGSLSIIEDGIFEVKATSPRNDHLTKQDFDDGTVDGSTQEFK